MDMETLRMQIAERKQAAVDKKISGKAEFIAKTLPEVSAAQPILWSYRDDDFNILTTISARGSDEIVSTFVDYKGTPVFFSQGAHICRYIPGPWEEHFESLHSLAVAKQTQRFKDQEAAAWAEEAKRFGL
jgi:hypothetical protein